MAPALVPSPLWLYAHYPLTINLYVLAEVGLSSFYRLQTYNRKAAVKSLNQEKSHTTILCSNLSGSHRCIICVVFCFLPCLSCLKKSVGYLVGGVFERGGKRKWFGRGVSQTNEEIIVKQPNIRCDDSEFSLQSPAKPEVSDLPYFLFFLIFGHPSSWMQSFLQPNWKKKTWVFLNTPQRLTWWIWASVYVDLYMLSGQTCSQSSPTDWYESNGDYNVPWQIFRLDF